MIGIVVVICLVKFVFFIGVKGGIFRLEIIVKYIVVLVIFLNSGLFLKLEELKSVFSNVRLYFFV